MFAKISLVFQRNKLKKVDVSFSSYLLNGKIKDG